MLSGMVVHRSERRQSQPLARTRLSSVSPSQKGLSEVALSQADPLWRRIRILGIEFHRQEISGRLSSLILILPKEHMVNIFLAPRRDRCMPCPGPSGLDSCCFFSPGPTSEEANATLRHWHVCIHASKGKSLVSFPLLIICFSKNRVALIDCRGNNRWER
jgi:hypothetical protein